MMADGELFRSREAQLYIEGGEESVLMQSGDFALVLVKNAVSQLAVVVAMVGAVQWPVGRDCAVTRRGEASFSFSLPGPLSYALVLRSTSSAADLQSLLEEYSTFSSPQRPAAGSALQHEVSQEADEINSSAGGAGELSKKISSGDDLSPEMVGRMQRARRMSAIAKVFSKSLERGAINAATHVKPMASTQDSRTSSLKLALAGVDAVAKVVEAVETGGRTVLERAGSAPVSTESCSPASAQGRSSTPDPSGGSSSLICSAWTLNNHGLQMLYRVITASMALHSGASSRSGTSRSGSSSSSEFRRFLSSSPSSSSLSSMSPSHIHAGAADARGSDVTSILPPAGTALSPPPAALPPPPLFTSSAPRVRMSDMPPPSGPLPPPAPPPPLDSPESSSFRIYKPRPTPAYTPPAPPPFLPRPPRFQPPQD